MSTPEVEYGFIEGFDSWQGDTPPSTPTKPGWVCTKCGRSYSPRIVACEHCNKKRRKG